MRYAVEKHDLAESIDGLRQIADGRSDVLALLLEPVCPARPLPGTARHRRVAFGACQVEGTASVLAPVAPMAAPLRPRDPSHRPHLHQMRVCEGGSR